MMNPETRASLILRLADPADDVAWAEFLEIYEPMLNQLASRWGLQEADAREVVQETLLGVVSSIKNYQPQDHGQAFRGWLASITRNKLVDHLSRRARREKASGNTDVHRWLDQQAGEQSSASIWDWHEKRQIFRWASEAVRPAVGDRTWQAFYRTSVLNEPVSDVAGDLGMREGMVYVARSRVMSRLRRAVETWLSQQDGGRMMQCDHVLLWTLIEQESEPSESLEAMARHLESCDSCRQELSNIGGDANWWQDASQYLREGEVVETSSGGLPSQPDSQDSNQRPPANQNLEGDDGESPLPPIDVSFLDPPSHPEMLGRIGRYDVEGLLGRGGMGVVMRGYDRDLHRSVAIKVLAPEWAASGQARQRFAREAQAAASVAHQNVVPIYNVEADADLPYLVMAYIPGMTLERWVRTHGTTDTATTLRVAGQLADGLGAAHRRSLVHRDVKPGNIMVGENIDRVWITDFGLALRRR